MTTLGFVFDILTVLLCIWLIAAAKKYFSTFAKASAEVDAQTAALEQIIANQAAIAQALEDIKQASTIRIATESEKRECIYQLIAAIHGLTHAMCWLGWDAAIRRTVRRDHAKTYDADARKFLPEIMARHALLSYFDTALYKHSLSSVTALTNLDARFGEAVVLSEQDPEAAAAMLEALYADAVELTNSVQLILTPEAPPVDRLGGPLQGANFASARMRAGRDDPTIGP